jgi:hypothetical protein
VATHRVPLHRPAVGADDPQLPVRAGEAHRGAGHRQVRPELLGLEERAVGQVLPGDAHREAEVVLDARARSGLAARRAGLEHQHVEPLGGRVDRGGQPGRPRAHHHEVVHVPVLGRAIEAERGGHLRVARVAHGPVAAPAHHHRDLRGADPEVLEQRVHLAVALHVQVDVGMAVAHQERLEPQGVRRVAGADQHRPTESVGDEVGAPQGEGAQEQLAQLRVGLHDVPEVGEIDLEQRGRVEGLRLDQAVSARHHVHLAQELPGPVDGDPLLAHPRQRRDLHAAFQQHVERALGHAALVDGLGRREAARAAERAQPLELRGGEPREHRLVALRRPGHAARRVPSGSSPGGVC